MIEEIYLVSPNIKYKETYIAGVKELQEYVKLNLNDVSARETAEMSATQNDIEELERDFENFVSILLDKEKPYEERMSLYDKAPDNVKKFFHLNKKLFFKAGKLSQVLIFGLLKKMKKELRSILEKSLFVQVCWIKKI